MPADAAATYISPFASTHEVILTARLLQTLFLRSLDSSLLHYNVTELDFYSIGGPGNLHGIKPGLAHGLWYTLQRLGRIILCAAHNYIPGVSEGPMPSCIPTEALQEIEMSFPSIVYAETHPDCNPLVSAQPMENLRLVIATLQCVGIQGVRWISEAMRRSARRGEESLWRWGGFIELRDAHPSDFGMFADRVFEEINFLRRQSLLEELFDGREDDEERRGPSHFESDAIDSLREFLVSHTTVFSLQDHRWGNIEGYTRDEIVPGDLEGIVALLSHLGLTDIVGVPMRACSNDLE